MSISFINSISFSTQNLSLEEAMVAIAAVGYVAQRAFCTLQKAYAATPIVEKALQEKGLTRKEKAEIKATIKAIVPQDQQDNESTLTRWVLPLLLQREIDTQGHQNSLLNTQNREDYRYLAILLLTHKMTAEERNRAIDELKALPTDALWDRLAGDCGKRPIRLD